MGLIYIKEEKFEDALSLFQQGLEIWKSIYGDKEIPLSTFYNKYFCKSIFKYQSIALCYKLLANYEEALMNLELSLKIVYEMIGMKSK